jgi:sorbitol-specific phosphotransferase system component IIC
MAGEGRRKVERIDGEIAEDAKRYGRFAPLIGVFLLGAAAGAIGAMALMPASDRPAYDDAAGASDPRGN